jgi:hypothetical protein
MKTLSNKPTNLCAALFCLMTILYSCGQRSQDISSKTEPDLTSKEGVKSHLVNNTWAQWDGKMIFRNDGTCNFTKKDLRTDQLEYDINGSFVVDQSKFEDNGAKYWYVKIEWSRPKVISDFYTIYSTHLVEQSREWLSFDSYGPILKSWRSEGGLVLKSSKIYPTEL